MSAFSIEYWISHNRKHQLARLTVETGASSSYKLCFNSVLEWLAIFGLQERVMRVLVTGGAGFIGSHLSERLVKEHHEVTIVDNLCDYYQPSLKRDNLSAIRRIGSFEFVDADVCNGETVERLCRSRNIEVVVHLAARPGVSSSVDATISYETVNVQGTVSVLEAMRRVGVPKLIFASSSSVYGPSANLPFREDSGDTWPLSPYAATKIAAEKWCYAYARSFGIQVLCLRLFTVFGPRQRPDLAISRFIRQIDKDSALEVFGNGTCMRDFTYCDDIVSGIMTACKCTASFEVINLGSGHPVTIVDAISTIELAMGKKARIEWRKERRVDLPATHADTTKASRILGYRSRISFEEGISRQVHWYRDTFQY